MDLCINVHDVESSDSGVEDSSLKKEKFSSTPGFNLAVIPIPSLLMRGVDRVLVALSTIIFKAMDHSAY